MKIKDVNKIANWLLVFLWLGVIYFFSSQPNLKSELEPLWDLLLRKAAHLAEFFVLAYLFFRAYCGHNFLPAAALVPAAIGAVTAAVWDEWHQSFTAGRVASIMDIGIDSLGALIFISLQYLWLRKNLAAKPNKI